MPLNHPKRKKDSSDDKTTETTESDDPNVAKVITKDWKPIGTEQTGDHVNSYSSTSIDWQEKRKAFLQQLISQSQIRRFGL